ncbi:hypothetical protein F2Q69_00016526 [Brassica cretica]|uniref:Uncharacterized protein n=1 Tax=Brassica cretica TaxID=69181 RepID=A0A8S9QT74_BRACR|nr:hypothetical protein F2Q69_00016526 [Brassica cretica]
MSEEVNRSPEETFKTENKGVDLPEDREGGEAAPSWRTDLPRWSSVKLQILAAKRVERKEREKLEGSEESTESQVENFRLTLQIILISNNERD